MKYLDNLISIEIFTIDQFNSIVFKQQLARLVKSIKIKTLEVI